VGPADAFPQSLHESPTTIVAGVLLKNPPDLTGEQRTTLAAIAKDNGALY
jgi:hypothetical protein